MIDPVLQPEETPENLQLDNFTPIDLKTAKQKKQFPILLVLAGVGMLIAGFLVAFIIVRVLRVGNSQSTAKSNQQTTTPTDMPKQSPQEKQLVDTQPFTAITYNNKNEESTITFDYPTDWTFQMSEDQSQAEFWPKNFDKKKSVSPITVVLAQPDFDKVVTQLMQAYKTDKKTPVTFSSLQGLHISGIADAGNNLQQAGGAYVFNHKGTAFIMGYSVETDVHYNQDAEKMIKTLQIK